MNIDEQIEYIEKHLKYLRYYPSSDYVLNMYRAILKTLKDYKEIKQKIDNLVEVSIENNRKQDNQLTMSKIGFSKDKQGD